jgi:hypothetical protein
MMQEKKIKEKTLFSMFQFDFYRKNNETKIFIKNN